MSSHATGKDTHTIRTDQPAHAMPIIHRTHTPTPGQFLIDLIKRMRHVRP